MFDFFFSRLTSRTLRRVLLVPCHGASDRRGLRAACGGATNCHPGSLVLLRMIF